MPKIILTPEESEEYFFNALCNAVGTGYMSSYGLDLTTNQGEYNRARVKLENPVYEDILMQILRDGGKLTFEDIEGDGDNTSSITLEDVHNKVQNTPVETLLDMINENDDADTADAILQTVFFNEIIFG